MSSWEVKSIRIGDERLSQFKNKVFVGVILHITVFNAHILHSSIYYWVCVGS